MKITDLRNVSPRSFQDLRDRAEHAVADELVICQFGSPAVFVGTLANEKAVARQTYCDKESIPIIRTQGVHRSSGYHDSNEFRIFAVLGKDSHYPFMELKQMAGLHNRHEEQMRIKHQAWQVFGNIMIAALLALGVKARYLRDNVLIAEAQDHSKLENEKKIGRLSAAVYDKVVTFNGHILLDWDIDTAEQAMVSVKHDMREHVRSLKDVGYNITFEQMRDAFIPAWEAVFGPT